jgi:predicted cytidylate kinase
MTRVICISGDAASGKTTAAKRVLARLPGWRIVSTGARFREYCARNGIDPQQISHLGDALHRDADADMLSVLTSESRIIAEGRLVGYLAREIADALRVFCACPLDVRADRFRQREPGFAAEEARSLVAERDAADTRNFLHLYGIDYHDAAYYGLILDTNALTPDEVADAILHRLGS